MKTISLELAKRLHELGFRWQPSIKESECVYIYLSNAWQLMRRERICTCAPCTKNKDMLIPAYTFEEIWAMLPKKVEDDNYMWWLTLDKAQYTPYGSRIWYRDIIDERTLIVHYGRDITEIAGLLLEWAIKEGHVERGE